jgi:hypothetical protein
MAGIATRIRAFSVTPSQGSKRSAFAQQSSSTRILRKRNLPRVPVRIASSSTPKPSPAITARRMLPLNWSAIARQRTRRVKPASA